MRGCEPQLRCSLEIWRQPNQTRPNLFLKLYLQQIVRLKQKLTQPKNPLSTSLNPKLDQPPPGNPQKDQPQSGNQNSKRDQPPPGNLKPKRDQPLSGNLKPMRDQPPPGNPKPKGDQPPPGNQNPLGDHPLHGHRNTQGTIASPADPKPTPRGQRRNGMNEDNTNQQKNTLLKNCSISN